MNAARYLDLRSGSTEGGSLASLGLRYDPIPESLPRGKSVAQIGSAAKLLETLKKQAETFRAARNYPQISLKKLKNWVG